MSGIIKTPIPWIFILSLAVTSTLATTLDEVQQYLAQGSYEEAHKTLVLVDQAGIPGASALWQSKLTGSPKQALEILHNGYNEQGLPFDSRVTLGLEIARIEYASGNHPSVIKVLRPLVDTPDRQFPGEVFFLMGSCLRSTGHLQKAREMLASVKPSDASFFQARYLLGEIGIQQNDATLALHYFDSALDADATPQRSLALAGRWKALRQMGEDQKAESLAQNLKNNFPGCLALLEIQGNIRNEEDEIAARIASQPAPEVIESPAETSGRYSLQLGAFSDRALALEFKLKYIDRLPELRVDEVLDSHGQFMYKIRLGNYANPAQARTDAKMWSDKLKTEVIVTDLNQ